MPLPPDGRLTLASGPGLWTGEVSGPIRVVDQGDTIALVADLSHEGADGGRRPAVATVRLSRPQAMALLEALRGRR